jgi:hypothetical protein
VAIVAFRFVVRVQLGETAGWVAFLFLQASADGRCFLALLGSVAVAHCTASWLPLRLLTCIPGWDTPPAPYCPSNQLPLPCPPPRSPPTLLLLLLQIYPRTFIGEASMYEKGWWQMLVQGWEVMVFNPGGCAVMWWCLL